MEELRALADEVEALYRQTGLSLPQLAIAVGAFGLLPAIIARLKGRNFLNWWVYGALFSVFALLHALLLGKTGEQDGEGEFDVGHAKICPECDKLTLEDAPTCLYCGHRFPPPKGEVTDRQRQLLKSMAGVDTKGMDGEDADREIAVMNYVIAIHVVRGGGPDDLAPGVMKQAIDAVKLNENAVRYCRGWAGPGPLETIDPYRPIDTNSGVWHSVTQFLKQLPAGDPDATATLAS